jgi:hypothetical protein
MAGSVGSDMVVLLKTGSVTVVAMEVFLLAEAQARSENCSGWPRLKGVVG